MIAMRTGSTPKPTKKKPAARNEYPHDRMQQVRKVLYAGDMYAILTDLMAATTPASIAAVRERATRALFEINTGQRCSPYPKQQETPK